MINVFVGRRLPGLLRRAGLVDVRVRPVLYIDHEPGHRGVWSSLTSPRTCVTGSSLSELITRESSTIFTRRCAVTSPIQAPRDLTPVRPGLGRKPE